VPAGAAGKARRAGGAFGRHHGHALHAFMAQRLGQRQVPLPIGRSPVGQQALLRKRRQLARQLQRRLQRATAGHHAVDQAHGQRLVGAHRAAGQDQIQRPPHADDARQPHRAAVDQRHTPAAAEHAQRGVGIGHPQVGQQGQLQPAGHGVALDGGDQRLGQRHARGPHGRVGPALRVQLVAQCRVGHRRQVGAGAKMPARAMQHRHAQRGVGLEALEGLAQRRRHRAVHGIAPVGAVERDPAQRPLGSVQHV